MTRRRPSSSTCCAAASARCGPRSERECGGVNLEILRPLLGVWRAEIEEYARSHRLKHREDASNASPEHTRNRLRHTILPGLSRDFGRDVRPSLWRAAEILSAQQECLVESLPPAEKELSVQTLRALPEALQRLALHRWLREQEVPQIGFELVEAIRALLEAPPPRKRTCPARALPAAAPVNCSSNRVG